MERRLRWSLRVSAATVGIMIVLAAAPGAHPQARTQEPVSAWVKRHAVPLRTTDPAAPLGDQAPLRRSIGAAEIVGLGESFHGAAEEIRLKHRALRLLVERMGFRSVAWEEDWTTGLLINEYVTTGKGDLDALLRQMSPQYQWRQVADVLRWLRGYNAGRAPRDRVRFAGVEFYFTPPPAYDAVAAHVAEADPGRLPELRRHLDVIRPPDDMDRFEYIEWYKRQEDKRPFIRHARELHDLVRSLPHRPGDRAHALAARTARQIVSFYEFHSLPEPDSHAYRDAHAAENLKWWRAHSGDKIAYWAASPHTADAPHVRLTRPPQADIRFASAGSFLRRWFGRRYLSIGFTFSTGTMSGESGQPVPLPPPEPHWFERPFGTVRADQFALDLRAPAPPPVRTWRDSPGTTRGPGPGMVLTGDPPGRWFDVIVHRQEVTPALPGGA